MTRILVSPSAGSTIVDKLKVYEGGTGAADAPAARVAIGAAGVADLNAANGVAGLDGNGLLYPAQIPDGGPAPISIIGVTSQSINTSSTFKISNYDIFTNYVIAAIDAGGSVSRLGDTITYTAGSAITAGGFTVNGRSYPVTITTALPNAPVLTGVDMDAGTAGASLLFTASAFAMNTGSNVQLNSDWQVASDSGFATVVSSSMADATNKTSWKTGGLGMSTTYYGRVRYRDSAGNAGPWSNTVTITTKASYSFLTEEVKFVAVDKVASAAFGGTVSISSDGTRCIVGAYQATSNSLANAGQAYVFVRSGVNWNLEAILYASDRAASARFGVYVIISGDSTRCAVGAYLANSGAVTSCGQAYVFVRTGTIWTQEAILFASDKAGGTSFGNCLALSSDASRCLVSSYQATSNGLGGAGQVYVFTRTGTSWTQEQILYASDRATNFNFGVFITVNPDATRCIAGAHSTTSGGFTGAGQAYVFLRTGTVWAQEQILFASDRGTNAYFGVKIAICTDASRCIVGANSANSGAVNTCGQAYIFTRSGTVWTQEQILSASDKAGSTYFGNGVAFNFDASRCVVCSSGATSGGFAGAGKAYAFTRNGTVWTQESILSASDQAVSNNLGTCVFMTNDGSRVIIGAPNSTQGGTTGAGSAYIDR